MIAPGLSEMATLGVRGEREQFDDIDRANPPRDRPRRRNHARQLALAGSGTDAGVYGALDTGADWLGLERRSSGQRCCCAIEVPCASLLPLPGTGKAPSGGVLVSLSHRRSRRKLTLCAM